MSAVINSLIRLRHLEFGIDQTLSSGLRYILLALVPSALGVQLAASVTNNFLLVLVL